MKVILSKAALKHYERLNEPLKSRISRAIDNLRKEPPEGDIKRLIGSENTYRLRVGNFRVIYSITAQEGSKEYIIVDKIASRGEAYKE